MKNLIIFTTKHGSVGQCSHVLQEKLDGETTIVNLKKDTVPNLQEFDTIILGGSIYMGKIQKELTKFMDSHLEALLQKRIALFICAAMKGEEGQTELKNAFPAKLYEHAVAKEIFGDAITMDKLNFLEKLAARAQKVKESYTNFSEENMERLAAAVNQH